MRVTRIKPEWYVPAFGGNRADPQPFRVEILGVSYGTARQWNREAAALAPAATLLEAVQGLAGTVERTQPPQVLEEVRRLLEIAARMPMAGAAPMADDLSAARFGRHVGRIQGLVLDDGTPITSGSELWARRDELDGELFNELWTAVANRDRLAAGLVSDLPSPSGSAAVLPMIAEPLNGPDGTATPASVAGSR